MTEFPPDVHSLIDAAVAEDQTFNDPTTQAVVPPEIQGTGMLRAKAIGVLAGVDVAIAVFKRVDPTLEVKAILQDGAPLTPGDDIAEVRGSAAGILRAERIALNFMQRMSGIASDTNRYVQEIQGLKARIVDTRKTVPGHRYLDKYSVRMGGGFNHRMNLADGILIKDNHIQANSFREMGLKEVIQLALARASHTIKVEVEVESMDQVWRPVPTSLCWTT
jgi:nicotinate-nucleotide pyrophosphorylase (carboxylating)